jgi:hypothetical protein
VEVKVDGTYAASYRDAVDAFLDSLSQGWVLGASMFMVGDGEIVVDVAGGLRIEKNRDIWFEYSQSYIQLGKSSQNHWYGPFFQQTACCFR